MRRGGKGCEECDGAVPTALGRCAESSKTSKLLCEQQGRPTCARPLRADAAGGVLRPVRESEVLGPGWAQAASTDHSKPTADGYVRQRQGFDQGLHRWKGYAHREDELLAKISRLVGWLVKLMVAQ